MESIPVIYVNVFIILLPSCTADNRPDTDLYQHQNIKCIKCDSGQYVVSPCKTDLGYSECKECEVGSYTYDSGAFYCAKCRDCQETYRQNKPDTCKSTQDTQCTCEDGKYWDTSICKTCDPPKHIIRSGGDKADQCVYCENGKYYNHSFPDSPCVECMKCDVGMSLVQQCNYTHDTICIPPATTPTPEETDKTDVIIACSVVGFLAVLIIIIIILYCIRKRKILVTRPKWLQPTINILTNNVGEVDLYLTGLPDVTNFNCAVKYEQIKRETYTNPGGYFSNFINQYYRADHETVTAQVFYDRLKDMQLNNVAEEMKNNQDINPFLDLITTDENHQPEENDCLLTGIQSNDQTVHNNRLPISNASNNAANTMYSSLSPGSESFLNGQDIPMADASSRTSGTSMTMCTEDHELSNVNHRTNRRDSDSVDAPRSLNQTNVKVGIKNKKDIDQTEVKEPLSA